MSVRSFTPNAVKREHIRPITVVYGNDAPGIALRVKRFESVLEDSKERPSVFSSAADAIPYMSCGDLFSDSVCVVVSDASDLISSTMQSKNLMKQFLSLVSAYDASSTVVVGLPISSMTNQAKLLLNKLKELNALIREVSTPSNSELVAWIREYAKSNEQELTEAAAEKIVQAGNNDPSQIKSVYTSIGSEAEFMSLTEIQEWLDTDEEVQPYVLRRYIANGDIRAIEEARTKFEHNASGYRTFMLKMRLACTDLVIASLGNGTDAIGSYKRNMYGRFQDVSSITQDASLGTSEHFIEVYRAIQDELSFISGGSSKSAKDKLRMQIAMVPKKISAEKRNRILAEFAKLDVE